MPYGHGAKFFQIYNLYTFGMESGMNVNYLYIAKIKNKRQQCHGGLSSKTPCINYNYYISFINICQEKNINLIQLKILVMAESEMYASQRRTSLQTAVRTHFSKVNSPSERFMIYLFTLWNDMTDSHIFKMTGEFLFSIFS